MLTASPHHDMLLHNDSSSTICVALFMLLPHWSMSIQFEESMITAKMEMDAEEDSSDDEPEEGDDVELDLRLARLENLMDR